MKISPHFDLSEFFQPGQSGEVADCDLVKARLLAEAILEPSRAALGEPILISSGKRSPEHNRKIGGVENSEHLWAGESAAVDLDALTHELNRRLYCWLLKNRAGQIGQLIAYLDADHEIRFIHLSLATARRAEIQPLLCEAERGQKIYRLYDGEFEG